MSPEESPTRREEFPRRVLVVDDEPLIRWATSSTLSAVGFTVVEASDVEGALKAAGSAGPDTFDLALLDLRLPDGDGVSLMHEIQQTQPGCRFIIMTAFRTPELTTGAAIEHIPILDKPFGMPELAGLVDRMMTS